MGHHRSYPLPPLHPFNGMDVWSLLEYQVRHRASMPFLSWHSFEGDRRHWSYASFARDALAVAAGLRRRGVEEGDRVIIHLENCPEFALAWFACAALGAVAVTTNVRSAPEEFAYFADDSDAVGVITQARFASVATSARSIKWMVVVGDDSWTTLPTNPDEVPARFPDPSAPMSVQYTSGTTSRPKGVVWTHANALWAARVNAAHEHLAADDCHLITMPLFHTNAMGYSLLPTMWTGARAVLTPRWSTSRFWDISIEHGCTWVSLMNLSARAILSIDPPDAHTYRWFGANAIFSEWEERFGVRTIGWWGMTETVSHGIVSDPWVTTRDRAIGRPALEYGIKVLRSNGETVVDHDETGALLIRGVPGLSLFAEYLNQPEATANSYDEFGWFRTGDLVTVHEGGDISFADRAKDMLKVGGENVAASEIERVIAQVAGVQEAAVIAAHDDKLDEVPVAFVIGNGEDLAERVASACRERLADFKVPRRVEIVAALPRSTISKVNKAVLTKTVADGTPLKAAEASWLAAAAADPSGDAG